MSPFREAEKPEAGHASLARRALRLVFKIARLYILVALIVFACQRCLIYHPTPDPGRGETLVMEREGFAIHAALLRRESKSAVVYFGGNAEDARGAIERLATVLESEALYALHYRGYGPSEGRPSEEALVGDALALFDRVRERHPHVRIIGRSLGTGIATAVAAEREADALVLITPFDRLATPAAAAFPIFPVRWMLLDDYDSAALAPRIDEPVTILIAANDDIVPPSSGESLHEAFAPGRSRRILLDGVGHNDVDRHRRFGESIRQNAR